MLTLLIKPFEEHILLILKLKAVLIEIFVARA